MDDAAAAQPDHRRAGDIASPRSACGWLFDRAVEATAIVSWTRLRAGRLRDPLVAAMFFASSNVLRSEHPLILAWGSIAYWIVALTSASRFGLVALIAVLTTGLM